MHNWNRKKISAHMEKVSATILSHLWLNSTFWAHRPSSEYPTLLAHDVAAPRLSLTLYGEKFVNFMKFVSPDLSQSLQWTDFDCLDATWGSLSPLIAASVCNRRASIALLHFLARPDVICWFPLLGCFYSGSKCVFWYAKINQHKKDHQFFSLQNLVSILGI